MSIKIKLLLLFLILCAKVLFADEAFFIEENLHEKKVSTSLYILEDVENKLSIEELMDINNPKAWIKNTNDFPNFGFTKNTIWTKISFYNMLATDEDYLLAIDFPRLDYVDIYTQVNKKIEKKSAGNLISFSAREIKHRNPVFEIRLPAKQISTFYFRFGSQTSVQFPLSLYSKQRFAEKISGEQILHGIHFGIVILSALYGILLFRLMKDWSNLLFSLFSLSVLFVFLVMTGIGFQYIWRDNPEVNHFNSFAILLSNFFGLQFTRLILDMKKYSPRANNLLNWITVIILFETVLLFFIPYSIGIKIGMITTILSTFLIVAMGFIISLKNYKPGIYIFIASVCGLMEWSIRILHQFGVINFDLPFVDTILIRCLERIILCLALVAKVQVIKEENEENQKRRLDDEFKIKERLSRINAEMEVQVHERTKDLEKEKEIAIRANRLKDNFITTVSHDLKSPILNVKNLLEILIQKEEMHWEERLYYLQNCQNALTSSYQMVYNILNGERFESGNLEIVAQYVDIRLILEKVILELEYSYTVKKISIELAANEDLVVIGDSQLLFQLFLNLVSNAIKFSFERTRVFIKVSEIKNHFQIEVIDFGQGMNSEDLRNLQTNSPVSKQGTNGETGTGFGLTIIRQILSLHDGSLEIHSEIGKGSNFSVCLPCHERIALCFSEEDSFYPRLRSLNSDLDLRIICIEELKNLRAAIHYLTPDYLFIGITVKNGKGVQELITIMQDETITTLAIFIQDYSGSAIHLPASRFSEIRINEDKKSLMINLKNFLDG